MVGTILLETSLNVGKKTNKKVTLMQLIYQFSNVLFHRGNITYVYCEIQSIKLSRIVKHLKKYFDTSEIEKYPMKFPGSLNWGGEDDDQ